MSEDKKNIQERITYETGEDATKYGEFISSYFAWVSLPEQKNIVNNMDNMEENWHNDNQNNNTDLSNYTATRTSTPTDNMTFLGMNSTVWFWLILALSALAVGILIYLNAH